MYRILLVEDDFALACAMKKQLEDAGNEVACVRDFQNPMEEFHRCDPHLVLMDIMLPYRDGYYRTCEIRKCSNVPIVFISSASDNMNIVMAINMGGDDFIAKPVEPIVLRAKVQAILRRTYALSGAQTLPEFHGAVLRPESMTLIFQDRTIELTKNETRILQTLLENFGKVVSRDTLMLRLWNDDCYVEENTLTVNVARLRKKLEENGLGQCIATKTGSGYMLT